LFFPTSSLWDQVFVCHPLKKLQTFFVFWFCFQPVSASAMGHCLFIHRFAIRFVLLHFMLRLKLLYSVSSIDHAAFQLFTFTA